MTDVCGLLFKLIRDIDWLPDHETAALAKLLASEGFRSLRCFHRADPADIPGLETVCSAAPKLVAALVASAAVDDDKRRVKRMRVAEVSVCSIIRGAAALPTPSCGPAAQACSLRTCIQNRAQAVEWVEGTRRAIIVGSAPKSAREAISAFRAWCSFLLALRRRASIRFGPICSHVPRVVGTAYSHPLPPTLSRGVPCLGPGIRESHLLKCASSSPGRHRFTPTTSVSFAWFVNYRI